MGSHLSAHSTQTTNMLFRNSRTLATALVRTMGGRSHPHLLRSENESYFVVKAHARSRHPRVCANELLANQLALILRLPARNPAIVEVPFAIDGEVHGEVGSLETFSLEFGSAFPSPPNKMLVVDFLPDHLLRKVTNLAEAFLGGFVFDLWTHNCGRREAIFTRPAGEDGAPYSAWLIDHDACFNDGEWNLSESFVPYVYAQHSVYETVKQADSFEPFLSHIENLKARDIKDVARSVPPAWCGSNPEGIFDLADQLFRSRKQIRQATANAFRDGLHRMS
jgi:HipA-like kinase